jgi:hypothetical protein
MFVYTSEITLHPKAQRDMKYIRKKNLPQDCSSEAPKEKGSKEKIIGRERWVSQSQQIATTATSMLASSKPRHR